MHTLLVLVAIVGAAVASPTNPAVCANCEFNTAGIGYLPNTLSCYAYIQCQKLADGSYIAHDMMCAPGTFWRQDLLTCDTENVSGFFCPPPDLCPLVTYVPCPPPPTPTTVLCYNEPHYVPNKYYVVANGIKTPMPCPSGTRYYHPDCGCTKPYNITSCSKSPLLKFPCKDSFNDIQCPKAVGTPYGDPDRSTGAMCLDGDDKIEVGFLKNWFAENPTTRFTLCLWFNQNSYAGTGTQGLFGNGDCNKESTVLLAVSNGFVGGKITAAVGSGEIPYSTTPRSYSRGVWNHVALVYNGWGVTLYLNGTQVGTAVASGAISNTQVHTNIGMAYVKCKAYFFEGCIDDVRVYTEVLSSWKVGQVYTAGRD